MPNLNIAIDDELMREIRVKAAMSNTTRREWVIENLRQAVEPAVAAQGSKDEEEGNL